MTNESERALMIDLLGGLVSSDLGMGLAGIENFARCYEVQRETCRGNVGARPGAGTTTPPPPSLSRQENRNRTGGDHRRGQAGHLTGALLVE